VPETVTTKLRQKPEYKAKLYTQQKKQAISTMYNEHPGIHNWPRVKSGWADLRMSQWVTL